MNNKTLMYNRIRNLCGLLGMILPWISILSVLFIKNRPAGSFNSISCTYYQSPALPAVLTAACLVLMTYDGYDLLDNVVTTVSGAFGLGIVLFPCKVHFDFVDPTHVGFFQVPMNVSSKIHCFCALTFFVLLAFNSYFLFTKSDGSLTKEKKIRNFIYKVCGIGMGIFPLAVVIIGKIIPIPCQTMIIEIFALTFFGISWLTKGGILFKDK